MSLLASFLRERKSSRFRHPAIPFDSHVGIHKMHFNTTIDKESSETETKGLSQITELRLLGVLSA